MSKGIYVDTDGHSVRFFGARKPVDPAGMSWHEDLDAASRALLQDPTADYRELRWDGFEVVRRDQAEIDAIATGDAIVLDDTFIDRERLLAVLDVLLDEINILRAQHGLPARTLAQARAAYKTKLNR